MIERFARAFPLWVTGASVIALIHPPAFDWFITGGLVTPGLALIMLAMGLTLDFESFRAVGENRSAVALGVLLQFTVMPLLGYVIGRLFHLDPAFSAGLVLVCCCPGGTASNVIAYLAKADVALSVTMTAVSTLLAALLTPTLTTLLVGQKVQVDVFALYLTTAKVVLLPVIAGLLLRRYAARYVTPIAQAMPALAVLAIVLIVAGILAVQRQKVLDAGPVLVAAVTVTHGLAFLLAFLAAGWRHGFGRVARTISIEVGMQNSGLGVVLARASFSANPLVAVTPAVSAVVHCLYGSALSAWWSRRPPSPRS